MNLGQQFKEVIDCMAENDKIVELAVKQLGKSLDKKHPPKSELGQIFKVLNKSLKLRKRIKVVQDKVTDMMIDESEEQGIA